MSTKRWSHRIRVVGTTLAVSSGTLVLGVAGSTEVAAAANPTNACGQLHPTASTICNPKVIQVTFRYPGGVVRTVTATAPATINSCGPSSCSVPTRYVYPYWSVPDCNGAAVAITDTFTYLWDSFVCGLTLYGSFSGN